MGLFSGNPLKKVEKAVKKAYDQVEGAVSDAWDKSGLDKQWNQWGRDAFIAAGVPGGLGALYVGGKLLSEEMVPDIEIPDPAAASPGAGVQVSQNAILSYSLDVERRRRAASYSLSDTNRTGNTQMRTSSLKSTLG